MGIEIVLHQHDLHRVGKMHIQQIPERIGHNRWRCGGRSLHMPPAFQRREHHEQIGARRCVGIRNRDAPCVLASRGSAHAPRRSAASRSRRGTRADAADRAASDRPPARLPWWRQRPRWRPAESPLLLAMRFENVFFSVRPIVLSLARSTMCSSTTFSSSRRRLHLAKPSGAGERVSAINFASAAPSKIRGRAELGLYLRASTASNPSSTSWRLVRSTVAMLVSSAAAIRLSLQPVLASDTSAFKRIRTFVSNCAYSNAKRPLIPKEGGQDSN